MRISFKEDGHLYADEEGIPYESVSHVVEKLEKKQDWEAKCKKCAKTEGVTFKELWATWEDKKTKGKEAGTMVHEDDEEVLIKKGRIIINGVELIVKPQESKKSELKWSMDITKLENNTVYPEMIIYSHKHRICGQADKVPIIKSTINIYDRKTDEEIRRVGFAGFKGREKLLHPVSHLDNCNFNLYSLKMSMYMYMLWRANQHLKIGKLYIEHANLLRDIEGFPVFENGKPVILSERLIEVPYRKREVEAILKPYGTN